MALQTTVTPWEGVCVCVCVCMCVCVWLGKWGACCGTLGPPWGIDPTVPKLLSQLQFSVVSNGKPQALGKVRLGSDNIHCLLGKGLCPNVIPAPVGERKFLLKRDEESSRGLEAREDAGAQVNRGGRQPHRSPSRERTAITGLFPLNRKCRIYPGALVFP